MRPRFVSITPTSSPGMGSPLTSEGASPLCFLAPWNPPARERDESATRGRRREILFMVLFDAQSAGLRNYSQAHGKLPLARRRLSTAAASVRFGPDIFDRTAQLAHPASEMDPLRHI